METDKDSDQFTQRDQKLRLSRRKFLQGAAYVPPAVGTLLLTSQESKAQPPDQANGPPSPFPGQGDPVNNGPPGLQ